MHLLHVIKSDSKESLNDFICNILKKFSKVSNLDETGNEHYLNAIYPSYNSFCITIWFVVQICKCSVANAEYCWIVAPDKKKLL